ncbi:MAG: hypothetical protein H6898_09045 [Rhodobacter sp.]|nr:hypothetical protein [Paracoccaceae bacterium]MCC0076715.1 hypothetical protein [Rhodobacter sp.]
MFARVTSFLLDETGATTIDWVVLTGGCMALAIIMLSTMNGATSSVASEMETVLTSVEVADLSQSGDTE